MKINYFNDPGHGWYAVKRSLLKKMGILDRISLCSYQRGGMVYLEEDGDASLFFNLYSGQYELVSKTTDNRSPIRSYDNFRYNELLDKSSEL